MVRSGRAELTEDDEEPVWEVFEAEGSTERVERRVGEGIVDAGLPGRL